MGYILKTKTAVLSELMRARDRTVSGGALSLSLGLTRQAVWKAVKALREDGYVIESIPQRGYRYVSPPKNDLDPTLIETLLLDCPWGHPVLFWESLDSTQIPAKELARKGAPEGLIVTTSFQTSGRGRLGRRWVSAPEGGIFFSLVIRPALPPESIQLLSLVSALSVQDALFALHGVRCQLKWPNDILWKDRKLCGILTEVSSEPGMVHFAVTGIGINANSSALSLDEGGETASLFSITGKKAHRGELIAGVVRYLHSAVRGLENPGGSKRALSDYASRCDTLGKRVRVVSDEGEVTGEAIALGGNGEIIIRTKDGIRSFTSADVNHLRALD